MARATIAVRITSHSSASTSCQVWVKPLRGLVPRAPLTAWATSPTNPFFAKSAVNRLWANFFGRGLVSPLDDIRPEHKPTHPELFDALAKEFVDSGFDLKHLIRCGDDLGIHFIGALGGDQRGDLVHRIDVGGFQEALLDGAVAGRARHAGLG